MTNNFFTLHSCCQLVKGACLATICDLQRNKIYRIPLSLYDLFNESRSIDFAALFSLCQQDNESKTVLKEYIQFLSDNELGVWGSQAVRFIDLPTEIYVDYRIINNCIIDFDRSSQHDLRSIADELTQLRCEYLELRYFSDADCSLDRIAEDMSMFDDCSVRGLEIVKKSDPGRSPVDEFDYLKQTHFRLTKYTAYGATENKTVSSSDFAVVITRANVDNEHSCGCFGEFYCVAETNLFIESLHHNNCLNRKIAIDKVGNIKNCPSMRKAYGNLSEGASLVQIATDPEFQKIWSIKKDDIDICKDCELRYVCQDCRAYIVDETNIYSKPIKCLYDPFHS